MAEPIHAHEAEHRVESASRRQRTLEAIAVAVAVAVVIVLAAANRRSLLDQAHKENDRQATIHRLADEAAAAHAEALALRLQLERNGLTPDVPVSSPTSTTAPPRRMTTTTVPSRPTSTTTAPSPPSSPPTTGPPPSTPPSTTCIAVVCIPRPTRERGPR